MKRLMILIGRLCKSVAPTKYFFKVPQFGRFMALVGVIRRCVEFPLMRGFHVATKHGELVISVAENKSPS